MLKHFLILLALIGSVGVDAILFCARCNPVRTLMRRCRYAFVVVIDEVDDDVDIVEDCEVTVVFVLQLGYRDHRITRFV